MEPRKWSSRQTGNAPKEEARPWIAAGPNGQTRFSFLGVSGSPCATKYCCLCFFLFCFDFDFVRATKVGFSGENQLPSVGC